MDAVGKKILFVLGFLTFLGLGSVMAQYKDCDNSPYYLNATYEDSPDTVCSSTQLKVDQTAGWSSATPNGWWSVIYGYGILEDSTDDNTYIDSLHYGTIEVMWVQVNSSGDTLCLDTAYIPSIMVYANAGPDQPDACSSTVLQGSDPNPGTGTWRSINSSPTFSNVNDPTATVSNLAYGDNILIWKVVNTEGTVTCADSDTVAIRNNTPIPVDAGVDDTTCTGDSIQLSATPPPSGAHGKWEVVQGSGTFKNDTLYNTWVTGLAPGINTFRWVVANQYCADSDDVNIYNFTIHITNLTDTSPVCTSLGQLSVSVTPNGTPGYWQVVASPAKIVDSTSENTSAVGLQFGNNTFKFIAYNQACKDSVQVTIKAYFVQAAATATNLIDCTDSTTLKGNDPTVYDATGSWSLLLGGGTIANPTDSVTEVTGLIRGKNSFVWTVKNSHGCSASDTVTVLYDAPDTASIATSDGYVCDSVATISANAPNYGTGYWTTATPGVTWNPDSTSLTTTVSGLAPGVNTFIWHVKTQYCPETTDTLRLTYDTLTANAGVSQVVCGGDTAQLNANVPPAGATGTWSVYQGYGVFDNAHSASTVVRSLDRNTVNILKWTVTDGVCTKWDTVSIINNSVNPIVYTDTASVYCQNYAQLSVSAPPSGASGYWKVVSSTGTIANSTSATTSVTNLNFGSNTFRWVVSKNGCVDSVDVTIKVMQVQAIAGASADTVCVDSVKLYGNDPTPYGATGSWSVFQGNGTFSSTTNDTTTVTGLGRGIVNAYVWTVSNGYCTSSDTVYVVDGAPTTAAVSTDTVISCDGSASLNANTPVYGQGYWTGPNGIVYNPDTTSATVTVSKLRNGTNQFIWHIKYFDVCPESTDTVYAIYDSATANPGGPYDTTCNGSIHLAATLPSGYTGQWIASSSTVTFDDATSPTATVSNLDYGANDLIWQITSPHGCTYSSTVTVYNYGVGYVSAGLDKTVCSTDATLDATPPSSGESGLWTTTSSTATIDDSTNYTTAVHNLDWGGNMFIWTVSNGKCSASDTVIIYNKSVTPADAGHTQYLCSDSTELYGNVPKIGTGTWSLQFGSATIQNDTNPTTVVTNLGSGLNIFVWTISNGVCSSSDTVHIYNMSVDAQILSPNPLATCSDTALITASPAYLSDISTPAVTAQGHWEVLSGVGTFDNSTSPITTVRGLGLDTNRLAWVVENSFCRDTAVLTVVNNSPTPAYAGKDTVICSTSYQLTGNTPKRGTGRWYLVAGGGVIENPTNPTSVVDSLEYYCRDTTPEWWITVNTVNVLVWTITYRGCVSADTVRIINGKPGTIDAGDDTTVCDTTVNLYAKDLGSCAQHHWWTAVPSKGITFYNQYTGEVDSTPFNARAIGLQKGITAFIWHKENIINGVTCKLTDTVYIKSLNITADVDAGPDDAVCDTIYKLNATPPSNVFSNGTDSVRGFWTVIYGHGVFDDSSQYDTYVRQLGYETNVLRWTVVNQTYGCVATDDLYLTNALPSNAVVYSRDTVVCDSEANLVANRPVRGTGYWTVIGGGAVITDPTCNGFFCRTYATHLSDGQNSFLWTVVNKYYGPGVSDTLVCKLKDTAFVYYNHVVANAGDTAYVCADTAQLNANLPTANPPYWGKWSVLSGNGLFRSTNADTSSNPDDVVYALGRGENTLVWTLYRTVNGVTCSASDNKIIWDNQPPQPDAGSDQTVCSDSALLTANSDEINKNYFDATFNRVIATARTTQYWTTVGNVARFGDTTSPTTYVVGLPQQQNTYVVWHKKLSFYDSLHNIAQDCYLSDTAIIYNNAVTAVAGQIPGVVCGTEDTGAYAVLNATPPATGQTGKWYKVSAASTVVINNPDSATTGVSGMQNGKNVFAWVVSATTNGVTCSASDTLAVEVRIPTTAVVASPDSFEVCVDTALLQGNQPTQGYGQWVAVYPYSGQVQDTFAPVTTVKKLWSGVTKWAWVINNDGCTSSDTITILNDHVYADAYDVGDTNLVSICVDTFKLSATDPSIFDSHAPLAHGQWSTGGTAVFDNDTLYNTVVRKLSNSEPNVLTWTITKGGCQASSQMIIYNNQFTIDADVSSDSNIIWICTDTVQMDAEQPGVGGHGTWEKINGGGIFVNDTLYNSVVTNIPATASNQYVWVVTRNGCTAQDTVTVVNNSITSQAGPDQVVCTDTTSLDASLPPGASGVWLNDLGSGTFANPNDPKTHVSGLAKDVNSFIWRVTKANCSAQDTVVVVNNEPEPAVAEDDKEICTDTTTLVVAQPPVSDFGYWKLLTGSATILDSTAYNAKTINIQPGINKFLWIVVKKNCQNVDTLVVTNNEVAANAGLDDTVCSDTAVVHAIGPSQFFPYQGTGQWSDPSGSGITFDNPADSVTTARNLQPGTNVLRWTVTKGNCSTYDDVVITDRAVFASASNITTCSMPVNLTGNPPVSNHGKWKNVGGIGYIANDTLYNSVYDSLPDGLTNTLRWIVYNESCADSVDITVTNNHFPVFAGADQVVCADSAQLNAQLPPGATGVWHVESGAGTFVDSTSPTTIIRGLAKGANILRWTVSWHGCTNSSTVTIVNSLPEAAVITGPLDTVTCDSSATLTAQSYASDDPYIDSKYWKIVEGGGDFVGGDDTSYTVTVEKLLPGNNRILWIITKGKCADTAQIIITNNAVTSNAGSNQIVCDTQATLRADAPIYGTGHWETVTAGVTIVDSTNNITQVYGLPHGKTTFNWIVTNGKCQAVSSVEVYNYQVHAWALDTSVCTDTVQLTANDPSAQSAQGIWRVIAGTGTLDTPSVYNTVLRGLKIGTQTTLQWKVYNDYCADSVVVHAINKNFYVNAYPDTTICTDSLQIYGTMPDGATGVWKVAGAGANTTFSDSTNDTTVVRNLTYGVNKIAWVVTKDGCTSTDTVSINNSSPSPAIIASYTQETCDSSANLSADKPTPYYATAQYWTVLGHHQFVGGDSTDFSATVTGLDPGQTQILWIVKNGFCYDTAKVTVTNNAVVALAESDRTICSSSTIIRATDPSTIPPYQGVGHWTANKAVTIVDPNSYQTQVSGLQPGVTIFTWTVTKGSCTASDDVAITDRQVFATAYDTVTCADTAPLIGNDPYPSGGKGKWSIIAGDGSIDNDTLPTTVIRNLSYQSTTTLSWTVTNGVCSDADTIQVISNNFYVSAGLDDTICADSTQLQASAIPDGATGVWHVVGGAGTFADSTNNQTEVTGLNPGANTLRWTVNYKGCTNYDDVVIYNSEPSNPVILTQNDTVVCDGQITLRADLPAQGSGQWSQIVGNGLATPADTNIVTVTGLSSNNNVFRWTITKGKCVKYQDVTIVNDQVFSNAGPDDTTCADTIVLAAATPQSGASGVWHDLSGSGIVFSDSTSPTATAYNLPQQSTVTLQWTVTKGKCSASDLVKITNLGVTATASNQITCDTTVTLDGNDPSAFTLSPASGKWTAVSGSGIWFDNDTVPNTNVNGLPYLSTVTLQWKITNKYGCADSVQITVQNNGFVVGIAGPTEVCGTQATVQGDTVPNWSGQWKVVSGGALTFSNDTNYITTVSNLGYGANTIRWVVSANGCADSADYTITNNLPYPVQITSPFASDTITCNGSISLQAKTPTVGTGTWSVGFGSGNIASPSSTSTDVTDLAEGKNTFVWTVDNGGCKQSVSVDVYNYQVYSNAGNDTIICSSTYQLSAVPVDTTYGAVGKWIDPNNIVTFSDVNDPNAIVSGIPRTTVPLVWQVTQHGCVANDTVKITNASVTATLLQDTIITCDTITTLTAQDPQVQNAHGHWVALTSGLTIDNDTAYNSTVHPLPYESLSTLYWVVNNTYCKDSSLLRIQNNGFVVFAGANDTVCADTVKLNGTEPGTGGTGVWSVVSGGTQGNITFDDSTLYNTVARNLGYGDNVLQWKVTRNGCSDSAQVVITNGNPYPVAIVSPVSGTQTCDGTIDVSAQKPTVGTGHWLVYGGAQIISGSSTDLNVTVGNLIPDTNKITWVVQNGACSLSANVFVVNNKVLSDAGNDDTTCSTTYQLAATRPSDLLGGTGHWEAVQSGLTFDDPTNPVTNVHNLIRGENDLVWVVQKGICTATDTVSIWNLGVYASAFGDTICDTSYHLNANNPLSINAHGYWKAKSAPSVWFSNDTLYNSWVYGLPYQSITTLVWYVYNDVGCKDSAYIQIVNNGFTISAGANQQVCDSIATLNGDDPGTGIGTWSVVSGNGRFDDIHQYNTTVRGLNRGDNILQWKIVKNGCADSAQVVVTNILPPEPKINYPYDSIEVCDGKIELQAQDPGTGYTGYWQQVFGNGLTGSVSTTDVTVTGLSPNRNVFRWTVANGSCTLYKDVDVINNQVTSIIDTDTVYVCSDQYQLNATPPSSTIYGGTGVWRDPNDTVTFADTTDPNTYVYNLPWGVPTNLIWYVTKGTCHDADTITIYNVSVKATANDTTVCTTDVKLSGNNPDYYNAKGYWKDLYNVGVTFDDSTVYNTTAHNVPYESNVTLVWTVYNSYGCRDTATEVITNNGFTISAGANDTVCADTAALFAQSPGSGGTGVWRVVYGGNNITFDDSTSAQTVVRNLAQGQNQLSWNVTKNGCTASDIVVVINNLPSEPQLLTPDTVVSCDGSVTLSAQKPNIGTGFWTQVAGSGLQPDTANTETYTVNNLSPNTNVFRWTVDNNGCQLSKLFYVINNEVVSYAGEDQYPCADSVQLHATDPANTIYGGHGYWRDLSNAGVVFVDSTDPTTWVKNLPNSPVTLQWNVVKGTCPPVSSTVTVYNSSVKAIAASEIVCQDTATLYAANYDTLRGETGWWTRGAPFTARFTSDSTLSTVSVDSLSSGANEFIWHVANAHCKDSVKVYVSNNEFTVNADPNGSNVGVCGPTYRLSADNPSPGYGQWTVVSGPGTVEDSTAFNSLVDGLTSNPTVLKWTVYKNGCSASDEVTIINEAVSAIVLDTTPTACSDSIVLQGVNPSPAIGVWRKVISTAPGVIHDTTAPQTYIQNVPNQTSVGLYWIVHSKDYKCWDTVTVIATNNLFDLSAGDNRAVCTDTAQLDGDNPSPGTGYWKVTYGHGVFDDSTQYNTVVRQLNEGDNILTWTVTKYGCTVSANVIITNNEVHADAGPDQTDLCVDTAQLDGNDPSTFGGTGYWQRIGGAGEFDDSTQYNTIVRGLRRGTNTFRWTVEAKGCSDYDDVVLINNSFDVNAGFDQAVCADTAELKAEPIPGGVGQWSVQGSSSATIDNPDNDTTVVRNLQRGTNVFRWTVTKNGCTFYDDVVITNNLPTDPVIYTTNPDTVCENAVELQANAPGTDETGYWTYTGSGGSIVSPTNNVTDVDSLKPGVTQFIWTLTHNGCSLSASITVINNTVTANAGNDQTDLCQNYTNLNALAPEAPAYGWWTKADGQPGVIAYDSSATTPVTNLGYGENKFVWHVQKGKCSATDTVVIINNSASPAQVGSVPPTCDGSAYLSATPPAYGTGQWSYIGTAPVVIESPSSANTKVTNLAYGANLFKWTVTNKTQYATCSTDTTLTVLNYQFTIDAGSDWIGCDSVVYLQAQTRPEQDSARWDIITGSPQISDIHDPNAQVILSQGASTVLKWTVWEHGCTASDYVSLENKSVTAIAHGKEVCGPTVQLDAVAPGNGNKGYWRASYSDITYSPDDSTYNATASNLHPGSNTFVWHVFNDYCSDSTTITVNYLIPYSYAGSDQSICEDYYHLSANDPSLEGGHGQWSIYKGNGTFDNDTLYNTYVRDLSQGENVLAWTVTVRACSHTSYVTLINNKPFVSVDNNPMEICDTFAILTGNQPDTANGEYGYWTKVTPGPYWFVDSTDPNTQVNGIQPGSEIVRWTVVNGKCKASADLIINNNMVTAYAGKDFSVCADSAQLAGYLPSNSFGYWQTVTPGPTIQDTTLYNTWVHNLNFGDNTFRWTVIHGGCKSSSEVTVTNNAYIADAGTDQTVCTNSTTLFGNQVPTGARGVWRLVGGYGKIVDSTDYVTKVTDLSAGANVFSWTIYNGECSSTDEVVITNNEVPVDAGAGDPALCDNKFELNANPPVPGGKGHWSVVAGYGVIDNPDTNITWVRDLARGENVLRWTVTRGGCTNYDEIVINNITPTQAVTIGEKVVCQDSTTITGNDPRYGVGYWKVVTSSSNVVIEDSTASTTTVSHLALGPNQFAWIIVDTTTGCSTSDTVTVLNKAVSAYAGEDVEICVDTFKLQATDPSPNTGYWSTVTTGGTFDNPYDPKTVVRDLPVGANILRWTVTNGTCSAYDDVIVTNDHPTQADAGPDQVSCDGTAILLGNTPDVDEKGTWIKLSGDGLIQDPTNYTTKVTDLSAGKNLFIWKITRGTCWSADTVTVDNHYIYVDAGQNREVCDDTALIRGNPPTSGIYGYWEIVGGSGHIDDSTAYQTVVRDLGPGANKLRWTLTDSVCTNYAEVIITNDNPTDPIVCYDTINICQNQTTLCANTPAPAETGYWTVAAGNADFENPEDPATLAYNLSSKVVLVWHIKKGTCVEQDTMYIFNGYVPAVVAFDSAEACGPSYYLAANSPVDTAHTTSYWTLISGSGTITDSTSAYTTVTNLGLGTNIFRWTVVSGQCQSYTDVKILNSKYPVSANMAATNPICDSQVVVLGSPPVAGGLGTWTVAAGTKDITFDDPHSPTTVARNLGNGLSILQWNVTVNGCTNSDTVAVINNSVYANAGPDQVVCDTDQVAQLLANDPQTANGLYGYWTVVSGSVKIADSTSYSTTVTDVAYGANTLKWTVVGNGCKDDDIVIVSDNHFTVTAGNDVTICDTTTILTGTDPGPNGHGIWTVAGSGWFEDPTNYTTRVNGIQPGANTYIWTVEKNGCVASDAVVVTNGTPTAVAGGDQTVCTDSAGLAAKNPDVGYGVWSLMSGSGTIHDPSQSHTYVTGLAKGDNVLRWTVYNGICSAYDEITITNNMVTATAGEDQEVCDTVAVMAADPPGPGGHGEWTLVAGGGKILDPTAFNTQIWGLYGGVNTFRWTVWENGCSNSTEVHIINNGFSTYAGEDQTVVTPSAQLNAETPPSGASGRWSIVAGAGTFIDQSDPSTVVNNLQYGINTFRWTVYNPITGCSAYDDVNIIYNGLVVDAGPDKDICYDTTQLNAQAVPNSTSYWTVVQGSCVFEDPTSPNTKIYNVQRGVNIFRWNVTKNGFTTYDDVVIRNYAFDTYAGPDQHLCDDSTTLDALYMKNYGIPADTSQLSAQWQFIAGGGTFANQKDPHTKVTNLAPGESLIRWSVTRNDYPGVSLCQAVDTVAVWYHKMPHPSFATNPESGKGCNPLKVTFYNTTPTDTVPGTQFIWNFSNMSLVPAAYNDTIVRMFYNQSDTDSVYPVWLIERAQVADGVVCADTVENNITVWAVPKVDFNVSPRVQLYPKSDVLIENLCSKNYQRYQWDFGDGTGVVQDTFVSSFTHSYFNSRWGTYKITLTVWSDHCSNSDTQSVVILAPEPISATNFSNSRAGCQPLTMQLLAQVLYTTPGLSQYKWIIRKAGDTGTVAILYDKDPVYTFKDAGTYYTDLYVTAEGTNPPWSWAYIRTDTITVYPKPVADFTVAPTEVTVNELIHCYNYSKGAVKYHWDFGMPNGKLTSDEENPVISYPAPGNYFIKLTAYSKHYCKDSKTLNEPVVVLPEGELIFPTAFNPTSPLDVDRVFKPKYRGDVVYYKLEIYNRWGQLIFVSKNIDVGWDGKIGGVLAPQDVYAYRCIVKFRSGVTKTYNGSVTLLR